MLGDRPGRKRLLLFGVASAVASQMSTADGLIALRAVMGVGAAPILVLMYSILPSVFACQERLRAVAVTSASTFIGPLAGGWLLASLFLGVDLPDQPAG